LRHGREKGGYLRWVRIELVARWSTVDGIANRFIDHLESSSLGDIKVFETRLLNSPLLDHESCSIGIFFAHGNRMCFLDDDGILVSVDSRVNTK
jgi:hypothetical protein